ncbi:MAG TPA: hypothetical protein EYN28_04710 [Flavobacteriales bacterium]|nr:hypothetical protein [Flavobacteriales bacterium]HIO15208.1 hypothetical protein [Flavobacteriales bacterium]HIO59457.1 hypothetical protein [Flavobacteriales bacterium]
MSKYNLLLAVFTGLFLTLNSGQVTAQVSRGALKAYEKAIDAYASQDYETTLFELGKALKKHPEYSEALFLSAQTHLDLSQDSLAKIDLAKALNIDDSPFETGWLVLADLDWVSGDYKEGLYALDQFERTVTFRRINTNKELKSKYRWIKEGLDFSFDAVIHPILGLDLSPLDLSINSNFPEYYPTMTLDGKTLVFTRRVNSSNGMYDHEDFFTSTWKDSSWTYAERLRGVNTEFNEGAPSISGDGRTIIFTACASPRDGFGDREGKGSCDLFESRFDEVTGVWSIGENLGKPNSSAWESQPTISSDGNFLVFARARHTRGAGSDLFGVRRGEDGEWGVPFSLPGEINTPYEEESPFLHPDGKSLYFSSNGHPGLGGLDMFVSRKGDDGLWGVPVNLGYPLNTYNNENSLLVEPDGDFAIFATDRLNTSGDLDLWRVNLPVSVKPISVGILSGVVVDAISSSPIDASVVLVNKLTGEILASVISKTKTTIKNGFILPLPEKGHYSFEVSRPGYMFKIEDVSISDSSNKDRFVEVRLEKIQPGTSLTMNDIRFETGSSEFEKGYQADLIKLASWLNDNPMTHVEIIGHTDNIGSAKENLELSISRANSVMQFLIQSSISESRLSYTGKGSSTPISSNDTEQSRAENRRVEIVVM